MAGRAEVHKPRARTKAGREVDLESCRLFSIRDLVRIPPKLTRTYSLPETRRAPSTIAVNRRRIGADHAQDARLELGRPVQIVSPLSDHSQYARTNRSESSSESAWKRFEHLNPRLHESCGP